MTGFAWEPVGVGSELFTGTFDGQNFTISNLTYDDSIAGNDIAGLFGFLGNANDGVVVEQAVVRNVNLANFNLKGWYAVGALAGFIQSASIYNVNVSDVNIVADSGGTSIGGLAGDCFGQTDIATVVESCSVSGATITGDLSYQIGGFIGDAYVYPYDDVPVNGFIIHKCFVENINITGDVDSDGFESVGGFAGLLSGRIYDCYVNGAIAAIDSTNYTDQIGGFVGENYYNSLIYNCYADVVVTAGCDIFYNVTSIGGFCGVDDAGTDNIIQNCYSTGIVTVPDGSMANGGFIGNADYQGYIDNPYITTMTNCAWFTGAFAHAFSITDSTVYPTYNSETIYNIGDKVTWPNNGDFICLQNGTSGKNPWYFPANWQQLFLGKNLEDYAFGTDEPDSTTFYTTDHVVYAQGT
jgi:hypothetical protein